MFHDWPLRSCAPLSTGFLKDRLEYHLLIVVLLGFQNGQS